MSDTSDSQETTFYIVRHGETDWNVKKILQGQTDILLNETGRKQAFELAQEFKKIKFDLVFSSDLKRAKHTVEIVALEHKLVVEATKSLRERKFGRLEGKKIEKLKDFSEVFDALSAKQKFAFKSYPEIESDEEITSRVITLLRELVVSYPNKTILIGTHGGVIYSLLIHLGFLKYKKSGKRHIKNTAYVKLVYDGINFFVKGTKGIEK